MTESRGGRNWSTLSCVIDTASSAPGTGGKSRGNALNLCAVSAISALLAFAGCSSTSRRAASGEAGTDSIPADSFAGSGAEGGGPTMDGPSASPDSAQGTDAAFAADLPAATDGGLDRAGSGASDASAAAPDRAGPDGIASDGSAADGTAPDRAGPDGITSDASAADRTAPDSATDRAGADGVAMDTGRADGGASDSKGADVAATDGATADGLSGASGSGFCSSDGWCWVSPVPQGNTLTSVWASGPADAWMGGEGGTLLHWNGTRLEPYVVTDRFISAIWGASSDFVLTAAYVPYPDITSKDVLLRWDGTQWAEWMTSPIQSVFAIWGTSRNDIWLVGSGAAHWDGSRFTVATWTNLVNAIAGSASDDVWVTNTYSAGSLLHFDGATWTQIDTPAGPGAVASGGRGKVWICGTNLGDPARVPMLWDGHAWSTPNPEMTDCWALWSPIAGDLWAAGGEVIFHYVAGAWQKAFEGGAGWVQALAGASSDDFWGVGQAGTLVHGQKGAFTDVAQARPNANNRSVAPVGPNDAWIASPGSMSVQHWKDGMPVGGWVAAEARAINDVMARSASDIWVVGAKGLAAHYDGSTWTETSTGTTNDFTRVWANAANDVWAVGAQSTTAWFDGAHWTVSMDPYPGDCTALWGNGSDLLAICQNGDALSAMRKFPPENGMVGIWAPRTYLNGGSYAKGNALWGTADGRIMVAGYDDSIAKGFIGLYQGSLAPLDDMGTFHIATQMDDNPSAIWVGSDSDVWVSGRGLYHWDGTSASVVKSPFQLGEPLAGLRGYAAGDVWAVGASATILHHASAH